MSRSIITQWDIDHPYGEWPLAVSNMTTLDKLKIGWWLLTEEQWTQGASVREYEKRWETYTRAPHVIMVANGSVANELIALRRKHELQRAGEWPRRNKVIFPVVNWISSISPWVNLGFEPIFADVGHNMCTTHEQIAQIMEIPPEDSLGDSLGHSYRDDVAAVFYTSLLGFAGNIQRIQDICHLAQTPLYLDNCESSFTRVPWEEDWSNTYHRHISNIVTSTTSLYASHHTSGTQEGGLIFCQSDEEADWYRMARNHGMTRGMDAKYRNPMVDPAFDFYLMGSNYRSTNLLAYMASLDLDRALAFAEKRQMLSRWFSYALDIDKFEHPHYGMGQAVPLSLPIVAKPDQPGLIQRVKGYLKAVGIEYRPIVGGNLLYQTAFKQYGDPKAFPRADHIHHNGIYIGLHKGVTRQMVEKLGAALSTL